MLIKQIHIFCDTIRRLYVQLTWLHHYSNISKEQHHKLLPLIEFKKEHLGKLSYECEIIDPSKNIPNNTYVYGLVHVEKFLDYDDLLKNVNDTLTIYEHCKIMLMKKVLLI